MPHLWQISGSKSSLQVFTVIPSLTIQSQKYLKGWKTKHVCPLYNRGFNKHWRPTKHVGCFAHRGCLLFYRNNNAVNKKYSIKSEWEYAILICFPKGPLVFTLCFSHVKAIFESFFQKFLIGLRRICLRVKVCNLVFIICSLLVGIDCVTDQLKATFSWMKNTLFCPQI